jgi:6-phosphogluconolactonase
MKFVTALVLLLISGHILMADERFYLGTITDHSASQGIYLGSLDPETGKLGPISLAVEVKNPNFLALSPDLKFLYAAISTHGSSAVNAFAVQTDGSLKLLNERPSGGNDACHVSVDATGRNVFVANYGGGDIACFSVKPDGSLDQRTAFLTFTGSGPDPNRQKKPYAHSVYPDPENKHLYACDLGSDSIWTYKFDAAQGSLAPTDPPAAKVPPGSGPRHLAFSPNGKFVYVANEMGHTVEVFSRNAATGRLTTIQNISTLPPGTDDKNITVAEVECHPSGKWLYVSNRGYDTIAQFWIGPDGKLTSVQCTSSVVNFPRSFAIDPSGKWLIAAGQKDNRIAVLKIDPTTGELTTTDQITEVPIPVCVLFAPIKEKR